MMRDVLVKMAEREGLLFAWGWDQWSNERPPATGVSGIPEWSCTIGTVRALEDRDLVRRIQGGGGEKRDTRILTHSGSAQAAGMIAKLATELSVSAGPDALIDGQAALASIQALQKDARLLRDVLPLLEKAIGVLKHQNTLSVSQGSEMQVWCASCKRVIRIHDPRILPEPQELPHAPSCRAADVVQAFLRLRERENRRKL